MREHEVDLPAPPLSVLPAPVGATLAVALLHAMFFCKVAPFFGLFSLTFPAKTNTLQKADYSKPAHGKRRKLGRGRIQFPEFLLHFSAVDLN
jgi:hypothetical protein